VLCDLAGPKLRTGPVEAGPGVLHFWPLLDDAGHILARARVWVTAAPLEARGARWELPVDAELLERIRPGDELRFDDARGRRRSLAVAEAGPGGVWAEGDRNAYVASGAPLALYRGEAAIAIGRVGELPPIEQALRLAVGDTLVVTPDSELGRGAVLDVAGRVLRPARIGCTLPEVFRDVRAGDRIFFDDGKLGGLVREVGEGRLRVEITRARSGKAKLRGDRGINLPDTDFDLPALTPKDRRDLDFVVAHADLVGLSFVRRPEDVDDLLRELESRGGRHLGIVLKIETRRAFEQLPLLLLAALRRPPAGVMVARGDLGVEMGFSRLAEVQEEILWLCEAAHVPVVWATQVLESLAKKGMPSRAEVTDAAMSGRSECVMLNKGPHVVEAVRFLCDVLQRMQGHHDKKRAMLRRLSVSNLP
jgi:pyruvate kinase